MSWTTWAKAARAAVSAAHFSYYNGVDQLMFNYVVSAALLTLAVISDIKTQKIKNWINYSFMLIGLIHLICFRRNALCTSLIACAAFYMLGCIGASGWGDIKCAIALTLINGWKGAAIAYIMAQVIMVAGYLLRTPSTAVHDIDRNLRDIKALNVKIDNQKKRHIFAPYLAGGYITWIIFRALEVV